MEWLVPRDFALAELEFETDQLAVLGLQFGVAIAELE